MNTTSNLINPDRPPGILICGMPRSSTTWIFNVVAECLRKPDTWSRVWIASSPGDSHAHYVERTKPTLAKCHHFNEQLAAASDIVIYSYRDLRTAGVSYLRKFGNCHVGNISGWIVSGDRWRQLANLVIRYEEVENNQRAQAVAICELLENKINADHLRYVAIEEIISSIELQFAQQQNAAEHAFDSITMITPQHRTFQPSSDLLPPAERALYEDIDQTYAGWLHNHGYLDHQLGQDIDYQVAASIIESFGSNLTVVDVGAERGSFIDLALAHGAQNIYAFEPLPRHITHLKERYAGRSNVHIHSMAVSDRTGKAELHIATDRQGNELDYFHSLSTEVGDSIEVIRSQLSLPVHTVSISECQIRGLLPEHIDFLKIDTDGHDLAVLHGLGRCRPTVIMAEFWEDLPATSGHNPYTLLDLVTWARNHDYPHHLVIRRRGIIESIALDESWSESGDWGNVVFFSLEAWKKFEKNKFNEMSHGSFHSLHNLTLRLTHLCEEKESVIQGLKSQQKELSAELALVRNAAEERLQLIERLHEQAAAETGHLIGDISETQRITELEAVLHERNEVISRLDTLARTSGERAAIAEYDRNRFKAEIGELQAQIGEITNTIVEAKSKAEQQTQLASMLDAVARERGDLIETLDAAAHRANERAALAEDAQKRLESSISELHHQMADVTNAAVEANAKAELQAERASMLEAVAQERAELIQTLDAAAHQARERATLAEDARQRLTATISELHQQMADVTNAAAEANAKAEQQAQRASMLEAVAQERATLIQTLDAAAHQARERATLAEDACQRLTATIGELHHQMADVTNAAVEANAKAEQQAQRASMLEAVAQERHDLIVRLDQLARNTADRAAKAEALTEHLRHQLGEQSALASSTMAQAVELTVACETATEKANRFEHECTARQTVIDELVNSRNALIAAINNRPSPWLGRLFRRK